MPFNGARTVVEPSNFPGGTRPVARRSRSAGPGQLQAGIERTREATAVLALQEEAAERIAELVFAGE